MSLTHSFFCIVSSLTLGAVLAGALIDAMYREAGVSPEKT